MGKELLCSNNFHPFSILCFFWWRLNRVVQLHKFYLSQLRLRATVSSSQRALSHDCGCTEVYYTLLNGEKDSKLFRQVFIIKTCSKSELTVRSSLLVVSVYINYVKVSLCKMTFFYYKAILTDECHSTQNWEQFKRPFYVLLKWKKIIELDEEVDDF